MSRCEHIGALYSVGSKDWSSEPRGYDEIVLDSEIKAWLWETAENQGTTAILPELGYTCWLGMALLGRQLELGGCALLPVLPGIQRLVLVMWGFQMHVCSWKSLSLWVKLTRSDKDGSDKDEAHFALVGIIL